MRLAESTLIFQSNQSGKPGYLLKSPKRKVTRVPLPWPKKISLTLLDDVSVPPRASLSGIRVFGSRPTTSIFWIILRSPFAMASVTSASGFVRRGGHLRSDGMVPKTLRVQANFSREEKEKIKQPQIPSEKIVSYH